MKYLKKGFLFKMNLLAISATPRSNGNSEILSQQSYSNNGVQHFIFSTKIAK